MTTDLSHIEALVGPLPKRQAAFNFAQTECFGDPEKARQANDYWRGAAGQWIVYDEPALAEADTVIERLAAELSRLREHLKSADTGGWFYSYDEQLKRRIAAEAEARKLRDLLNLALRSGINVVAPDEKTETAMIQRVVDERMADILSRRDAEHGGEG